MTVSIATSPPLPTPTPQPFITSLINNYLEPIGIIAVTLIIIGVIGYIVYKKFLKGKFFQKKQKELLFKDFNVGKYAVVMYRKIADRFVEIDKLKIDIKDEQFRYNNKDFKTFDVSKPAYSNKNYNYYAFDYDTGSQLTFKEKGMPEKITVDDIDIYVNRHIIEDLVKGLESPKQKGQWLMLIVGAVLGLGIGIVIGMEIGAPKSQSAKFIYETIKIVLVVR